MIVSVEDMPPFDTGASNAPVQVVITGSDLDTLGEISYKLMEEMKEIEGLVDIDRDYEEGKPQITVSIQRENAQRVGSWCLCTVYRSHIRFCLL